MEASCTKGSGKATRVMGTACFIFRVSTNTPVTGSITCAMDEVNVSMLMDLFMMANGKMMKGANCRRVDVPPENNPCIQVYKLHTILFHFLSSLPSTHSD